MSINRQHLVASKGRQFDGNDDRLRDQLRNVTTLSAKQDRVVWTIFGVFWAANAVLLAPMFADGKLPEPEVGAIVSLMGAVLSFVWARIQERSVSWLEYYDALTQRLEEHLRIPPSLALSGWINKDLFTKYISRGTRVRPVMVRWAWGLFGVWVLSFLAFAFLAMCPALSPLL